VLKKGGHFIDTWKERHLKVFNDRVDYYDSMSCLCGSMSLVKTTAVEVVGDSLVNIHTVGRKEKAAETKGRVFNLKFAVVSDKDNFVNCVNRVLQAVSMSVSSIDVQEPAEATVLPVDEFIVIEDNKEYANVEDSPEVDFYHAAKRYIHEVDSLEAAWEARSQRREQESEHHLTSPQSSQSPTKSKNSLFAKAFGGRSSWGGAPDDSGSGSFPSHSLKRSSSGGISRYEDPLLGIEPFTIVNPRTPNGHFPNLLQRSALDKYVETVDELCILARAALPVLDGLLAEVRHSLVENELERHRGDAGINMKDIAHAANQSILTETTLMSACDAIDLLAACNVHEYPDCDTPLCRATVPSTCFPLADVAPVAALVNVVRGRLVCSSTAQVKAAVDHFRAHSTVVTLDNRFLDPLGQPNVYMSDESSLSTSTLQLEALFCNGSYHRDIRLVLAVDVNQHGSSGHSKNSHEPYFLCEVIIETAEVDDPSRKASSGNYEMESDGIVWNKQAEKTLAARRLEQLDEEIDEGSVSGDEEEDDGAGTWRDSLDLSTGAGPEGGLNTKNRSHYSRYLKDYFTKFRSWSHVDSVFSDMSIEEVIITIRNNFSRDVIYRTELLRQVTALSLDDYLNERDVYLNGQEEEEETGASGGYFITLLRATEMTKDVKMMRSVCGLFYGMGLFSACAVLQRAVLERVRDMRQQDDLNQEELYCLELETLATLLLRDETDGYADQQNLTFNEAISLLNEAMEIRNGFRHADMGNGRGSNNDLIIVHDHFLLANICSENNVSDGCDEATGISYAQKATLILQEFVENTARGGSEYIKNYCSVFLCPKLGVLFEQNGDLPKSIDYFEKAYKAQNISGKQHPVVYQTMLDYGLMHLQAGGDMMKAKQYMKESLQLRTSHIMDCNDRYRGLLCLAEGYISQIPLYLASNDTSQCKALIEKAYHIRLHLFGDSMHTSIAECFIEYGLVCKAMRKYDSAVSYFEESLKMYYELLGRENTEVADTLLHLASVLELQQEAATALTMYKMSLKIRKALYGSESEEVVEVLLRMGSMCVSEKLTDSAERLLFEALSLQHRMLSSEHSSVKNEEDIVVFNVKGNDCEDKVLKLTLSDAKPMLAETVNLIACNYREKEMLENAMTWYNNSIEVTRAVYGVQHPNMALVWTHMAGVLKQQKKLKEAVALYEKVLRLRRDAASADGNSSLIAQSLNNLAIARQEMGEYDVARTLFEEALVLYLGVSRDNTKSCSAELAALYNNLAGCLHHTDPRSAKVARYGAKAVTMAEEVFGPDHPTTCRYRDNWTPEDSMKSK